MCWIEVEDLSSTCASESRNLPSSFRVQRTMQAVFGLYLADLSRMILARQWQTSNCRSRASSRRRPLPLTWIHLRQPNGDWNNVVSCISWPPQLKLQPNRQAARSVCPVLPVFDLCKQTIGHSWLQSSAWPKRDSKPPLRRTPRRASCRGYPWMCYHRPLDAHLLNILVVGWWLKS